MTDSLPENLKNKLAEYGFKMLDKKVKNKPYFHVSHPKLNRLWHEIMEHKDNE